MNQRRITETDRFIPPLPVREKMVKEEAPEAIMFDKAEEAEQLEKLRSEHAQLLKKIEELQASKKSAPDQDKPKIDATIMGLTEQAKALAQQLERQQKHSNTND